MSALEQLALAGEALRRTLLSLRSARLWVPWLTLLGVQSAALIALIGFAHPALSSWMAPLVGAAAGGEALHYPGFFRALPGLYSRVDPVLAALPGAVAAGWSTSLFAALWRGGVPEPRTAWAATRGRAATLVLALLPFHVLVLVLTTGLERAIAGESGMVRRLGGLVTLGGGIALEAGFLFVVPLVVLGGCGLVRALASLPRAWARGFWAATALAAVLAVPLLAFGRAGQLGERLVGRGSPEVVTWLVAAQIGVGLVRSFLLAGGATLVYLGAVASAPAGER
jgi:hypothetical protein